MQSFYIFEILIENSNFLEYCFNLARYEVPSEEKVACLNFKNVGTSNKFSHILVSFTTSYLSKW